MARDWRLILIGVITYSKIALAIDDKRIIKTSNPIDFICYKIAPNNPRVGLAILIIAIIILVYSIRNWDKIKRRFKKWQ